MNRGDRQRLLHIQSYCKDIDGFIDRFGKDFDTFISDRAYYSAVCMCVLQIGELSNGLSEAFREETKEQIPWGMVRGMRNWLAHAYADMDESTIWETVTNDIQTLKGFCDRMLAQDREHTAAPEKPSLLEQLSKSDAASEKDGGPDRTVPQKDEPER